MARVYPQQDCANGELARSISELIARERWKVEELHTEEGRLDEVFRSITLPETMREDETMNSALRNIKTIAKTGIVAATSPRPWLTFLSSSFC